MVNQAPLFPGLTSTLVGIDMFYLPLKGMGNRSAEYMARMALANHGEDFHKRWVNGKYSLCNYKDYLIAARRFNDGRMSLQINQRALETYAKRHYSTLTPEYFLHGAASSLKGIYLLYAGQPGMVYVGSVFGESRSFCIRWKDHLSGLKSGAHHCTRLQAAFNKTKILYPIILKAQNHSTSDIEKIEGEYIKLLWQNCYNTRKW